MLIYDLTYEKLENLIISNNFKKYRVKQIWHGLYREFYTSFNDFTNLPHDLITFLSINFHFGKFKLIATSVSTDRTCKYLWQIDDKNEVETVLIPHHYGNSICISSQVGCNMGCVFCASGQIKKIKDLSAGEMVLQIIKTIIASGKINSVVVMGIGEPFDNFANLIDFLNIINHKDGLAIGARHITVSTVGIPEKIIAFANVGLQVNLAISLHASNDEVRSQLIPINKIQNIKKILDAVNIYTKITNRRVTIEYILFENINSTQEHAYELFRILFGLNVYVNLINFNKVEHIDLNPVNETVKLNFFSILKKQRIQVVSRKSMGADINAACGQLRAKFVGLKNAPHSNEKND